MPSSVSRVNQCNLPEEELSVEIRYVDFVKINAVDISDSGQRQILEDLTAQTTCSNDQHFCIFLQTCEQLLIRLEIAHELS